MSTVLSKVLQSAKKVSDNIEKKARDLQKKIDKAGYPKRLEDAEKKLLEKEDEISNLEARVGEYQDTTRNFIYAFDTVGKPVQRLSDAVDVLVKPPNDAITSINEIYYDVSGDIDGLKGLIQRANFTPVLRVGNEFARIKEFVCQIDDVLSRAYSVIKPVAPLLNAVGFVYNVTVKPVVDFVLDKIGIGQDHGSDQRSDRTAFAGHGLPRQACGEDRGRFRRDQRAA